MNLELNGSATKVSYRYVHKLEMITRQHEQ